MATNKYTAICSTNYVNTASLGLTLITEPGNNVHQAIEHNGSKTDDHKILMT